MSFTLFSQEFEEGASIPRFFTCDGTDASPALQWNEPPIGTQSFTLIVNDPDAPSGDWVHWVLYDIPLTSRKLAQGIPADKTLSDGTCQGRNSWHQIKYGGPCPPSGTHRYFFRLYALDRMLELAPGADKTEVLQHLQGHVLAEAVLMGTYSR